MRRLLFLVVLAGLVFSVGCKDEKVIAPKDVPPAPKGPPMGAKTGDGGNKNKAAGVPVAP